MSRLGEVNQGFRQLSEGARLLNKGLIEGAAKLRAAVWLEQQTGLNLTGSVSRAAVPRPASSKDQAAAASAPVPPAASASTSALVSGLKGASTALLITQGTPPWDLPGLSKAFDLVAAANGNSGSVAPPGSADPSVQRAGHPRSTPAAEPRPRPARTEGPAETLLAELTRAADGADQIARALIVPMTRSPQSSTIPSAVESSIAC